MADEKMNVEENIPSEDEMDASKGPKAPEDISNDGGVLKEIIKEGSGWEKPENGSDVKGKLKIIIMKITNVQLFIIF